LLCPSATYSACAPRVDCEKAAAQFVALSALDVCTLLYVLACSAVERSERLLVTLPSARYLLYVIYVYSTRMLAISAVGRSLLALRSCPLACWSLPTDSPGASQRISLLLFIRRFCGNVAKAVPLVSVSPSIPFDVQFLFAGCSRLRLSAFSLRQDRPAACCLYLLPYRTYASSSFACCSVATSSVCRGFLACILLAYHRRALHHRLFYCCHCYTMRSFVCTIRFKEIVHCTYASVLVVFTTALCAIFFCS